MGIIEQLIEGNGVVRAATIRTSKSTLQRAIQHLYPLELTCDQNVSESVQGVKEVEWNVNVEEFQPKRKAAQVAKMQISRQIDFEQNEDLSDIDNIDNI